VKSSIQVKHILMRNVMYAKEPCSVRLNGITFSLPSWLMDSIYFTL